MVRRLVALLAVVAVLVIGTGGGAFALPGKMRNALLDAHRADGRTTRVAVRQDAQPPPPPPRAKPVKLPHTGPSLPAASTWIGLALLSVGGGSLLAIRRARAVRRLR
jgi:LPXTG-motif cell wall-anchored protein